ncbi:ribose-phosphate pyrophosphokinase-like domain-containing protein, partial [Herbiconiux daphne]
MITLQINGVPVRLNWTTFPDTARGASISGALPTNPVDATIFARPDFKKGVNEMLFDIGMVVNILRNINNRIYIKLLMPYIPYARQDRNMVGHDAFTLKVFAAMLNSYNLDSVVVVDPHSDVSTGLINNVKIITQADVIGTNPIAEVL